jgi:ACS family hexuronate transporter-like MFS transporter
LAVAVHQGWATNVFTLASDMFPKQIVSSVVGIAGMSGALGGILFPMLVGFLLDYYKAFGNISIGYNIIFTFCGCTYLVVWLIIMFLIKRSENARIETVI